MNERLAECDMMSRLLFIGLWTLADREGRLECRPRLIRAHLFPHENLPPDIQQLLKQLEAGHFIQLYTTNESEYISINGWKEHQKCHHKEVESQLPEPPPIHNHAQTMDDSSMDQA